MSHLIAPSILSADFSQLGKDITLLENSRADWIHIDVMDGSYVPNISFGLPVVKSIRKYTKKPFDVHLMMNEPQKYLERFKEVGADHISVHLENNHHLHSCLQKIKELGMKAGIAINPGTPISALESIIVEADIVIIMSVNPGFGGQKFIPESLNRISELRDLIAQKQTNTLIQVDGGVGIGNAQRVLEAGADVLVAGSAVFNSDDPKQTIEALKSIQTKNIIA